MSSLRTRLVLWFVAVLTVTLLAFAAVLFVAVRVGLWREFDLQLQLEAESARSLLAPYWTIDGVSAAEVIEPLPAADRRWVEVWSPQGVRLFASPQAAAAPLPASPPPDAAQQWSTTDAAGAPVRVLDLPTDIIGLPVVIRAVAGEARLRAELDTIALSIVAAFVVCLGVAAWGGYGITRRALRPMESLVAQTADVTAERLHRGITIDGADDEVAAVATAFNATLRRLEVSFEQARRFSADASHELRTPVTAIRSVGQVALQNQVDAGAQREALASMVEEAERLARLLDTLLLLSRADARQVDMAHGRVDLDVLVRDVVTDLEVLSDEKQQALTVALAPAAVLGDAGLLRLAIGNLLDNAIRYTPAGGAIHVTVAAHEDAAVVAVTDTGPGIAEEHQARVFDRFYRVEPVPSRQNDGSGLGLSIVSWAAAMHGGRVTLDSTPGQGSTFRLRLPLAGPPDVKAGLAEAPGRPHPA